MILLILEMVARAILPPFYSFSRFEKVLRGKIARYPTNPHALWLLSNLYIWHGDYKQAKVHLESLVESGKDTKSIRLVLSRVYFKLAAYSSVVSILSKPGVLAKNDSENYYLGDSLINLKSFKNAIDPLEKYTKFHPKNWEPFVRLGYAYYMTGRYGLALKAYKTAESLNPAENNIKNSITACQDKLADITGNQRREPEGSATDTGQEGSGVKG